MRLRRLPEVAGHVEALVVAIQHEHSAAVRARLAVQLAQQQNGPWPKHACTCQHVHPQSLQREPLHILHTHLQRGSIPAHAGPFGLGSCAMERAGSTAHA